MTRRTLLKLLALIPVAGPAIAKVLIKADYKSASVRPPYLPSHFPKWNRAVDDLENAGQWALEMERSRLPRNTMLPRPGQIWEAVRDFELSSFRFVSVGKSQPWALVVGGKFPFVPGTVQLRQGERVRILETDGAKPVFVHFAPLRHDESGETILRDDLPSFAGYVGYRLKTARTIADFSKENNSNPFFTEAFRLVQDAV